MILCPKCGNIADWSSYSQKFKCNHCTWTGKRETELSSEVIEEVITNFVKRSDSVLLEGSELDLEKHWFFSWDEKASIEWNTYQFSDLLELYKRVCRRWEEHHNGYLCVVERVRDKYLMPKIKEFLVELAKHSTEKN